MTKRTTKPYPSSLEKKNVSEGKLEPTLKFSKKAPKMQKKVSARTEKPKRRKRSEKSRLESFCDSLWSEIIREEQPICRICAKRPTTQAHHIFGRSHKVTRHNLLNGLGVCYRCHQPEGHSDPCAFTEKIKRAIGEEQYAYIEKEHLRIIDYGVEWLTDVKEELVKYRTNMVVTIAEECGL